MRASHLKKNIYVSEVRTESVETYWQGRRALEGLGYTIRAIVLDGSPGLRQVFSDIPVQMCHFHQKQIVTRYLTNNPRLKAGIEPKGLVAGLCEAHEIDFTSALDAWHDRWSSFMRERITDPVTGKDGTTRTRSSVQRRGA